VIATYNKRDFPAAATEPWGIEFQGLARSSCTFADKLPAQARDFGRTLREQLAALRKAVPAFVDAVCQDLPLEE
jgi:hypothetical protein